MHVDTVSQHAPAAEESDAMTTSAPISPFCWLSIANLRGEKQTDIHPMHYIVPCTYHDRKNVNNNFEYSSWILSITI